MILSHLGEVSPAATKGGRPTGARELSLTAQHSIPLSLRQSFGRQTDAGPFAQSLMDYSERHLTEASKSGSPNEAQLATRLLQDVSLFSRWEQSHGRMMLSVAAAPRTTQRVQLRKVAFATLHRKAPFEYLRDRRASSLGRCALPPLGHGTIRDSGIFEVPSA